MGGSGGTGVANPRSERRERGETGGGEAAGRRPRPDSSVARSQWGETMSSERLSGQAQSSMPTADTGVELPVDIIESIRDGSNSLDEPPLPGHGDAYGPDDDQPTCGDDHTTRVCDNCGDDHQVASSCDRWECPRCYKRAVLKAGIRTTAKLAHYRDKYARGDELRFHRVIVSPPDDFSTVADDPLDRLYDAVGDLLEQGAGYHGGILIPHPYRHADEANLDPDADDRDLALVGGDDDQGIWKHTLPDWADDHTPSWSETRDKLSHEPHFHCYIVSESMWLPTEQIYDETGWFIRRLEPYEDNNVSCYGVEDLARSVMYALSHCGDYDNRDHYRFFGAIANESASDAQETRMSYICRDYADHVLGLPASSVTCQRDVSDVPVSPVVSDESGGSSESPQEGGQSAEAGSTSGGPGSGGSRFDSSGGGSDSSGGGSAPDDAAVGDDYAPCNGRLVHYRQIPDLLDAHEDDWPAEIKQNLRDLYEDLTGEPPPD